MMVNGKKNMIQKQKCGVFEIFGFDDISERTIEAVKKAGFKKIKLSFKGEGLTAEIDLRK